MTTAAEQEWHIACAGRLRGDIVNLAVAAQAMDKHGWVALAEGTRVLLKDLQAQALVHEEAAAKGGDSHTDGVI
jgi:hypothetical protein